MTTPIEAATAYFEAWNSHDADGIVKTFAAGGTYTDPASGGDLTGQAIGRYAEGLREAFPDLSFEIVSVAEAGPGTVAAQWLMKGTNTAPFRGILRPARRSRCPGQTS